MMPPRLRSLKSLSFRIALSCSFAIAMAAGESYSVSAQETDSVDAREKRAAELDAKVSDLRAEFRILRDKWDEASEQAKETIDAELAIAREALSRTVDDQQKEYGETVDQLKASLEAAWQGIAAEGEATGTEAMAELNKIRDEWTAWYKKLRQSHRQQVDQMRDEMASLEKQIDRLSSEISQEWIAKRSAIRKAYQADAKEMREVYNQSITSLQSEIEHLQANAKKASAETRAEYEQLSDALSQQTIVLHQELQASYAETASKARLYLTKTEGKLAAASADVKTDIQAEVDQVSELICELHAEMTDGYQAYRDWINQQIESLKSRSATASESAKQQLKKTSAQLHEKLDAAEEQANQAYVAYAASLNAEVDRIKERLAEADQQGRDKLVDAIERHQTELERVKQKLHDD